MTEVVRKSALKGRCGGRGKRPRESDSGAALAESAASGHTSKPARRDNVQQPSQQVHFQLHSYAMMLEMQGDLLGAKQQYLEALKVKLRRWPGTKVQLQGGQVQVTKLPKQRPATLTYR